MKETETALLAALKAIFLFPYFSLISEYRRTYEISLREDGAEVKASRVKRFLPAEVKKNKAWRYCISGFKRYNEEKDIDEYEI